MAGSPYNEKSIQTEAITSMKYYFFKHNRKIQRCAKLAKIHNKRVPASIHVDTLVSWFEHYLEMGELPSKTRARLGRNWRTNGLNALTIFSEEEFVQLEAWMLREPVVYLDEMVDFMAEKFGKTCSISTMWRMLTAHGYTRKKVYEKASQVIQLRKDIFIEAMRLAIKNVEMVIFIDESSKDRHAARRSHGWSKRDVRVHYRVRFNMDIRYTLIGCADCYGFVPHMCDVVMHKVDGKKESAPVDGERFVEYMKEKVVPYLGNYALGEAHSVVVMDNCSVHMSEEVEALISEKGAILLYSAPYAPDLIPIESMFKQWKSYLKRHHVAFGKDWRTVHYGGLASVTPEQGLNYFRMTTLNELVDGHPLLADPEEEEDDDVCALLLIIFSKRNGKL
jgi:hypothetical protein